MQVYQTKEYDDRENYLATNCKKKQIQFMYSLQKMQEMTIFQLQKCCNFALLHIGF